MAEKPEDLNLPNAVIARLVKEALPDGVNISKEARSAIGKAASVFVLYATSCANNYAQSNKRKTLAATDVFQALEDMEFESFVDPLKSCLELFRKEQKGKKEAAAEKRRKAEGNEDSTPSSKRQKTDENEEKEAEDDENDDGGDSEDKEENGKD